jgi:hypothetical protein
VGEPKEWTMNQYGHQAMKHWQQWLPKRYAALESPQEFFSKLGEEVLQEIDTLTTALAGKEPPGEEFLAKVQRLQMAKFNATEQVVREMVLIEPEESDAEEMAASTRHEDEL